MGALRGELDLAGVHGESGVSHDSRAGGAELGPDFLGGDGLLDFLALQGAAIADVDHCVAYRVAIL